MYAALQKTQASSTQAGAAAAARPAPGSGCKLVPAIALAAVNFGALPVDASLAIADAAGVLTLFL